MRTLASTSHDAAASTAPAAAFDAVYAEHFSFVWRCLRALGVRPEGLDDAVQDAFLIVHRRLHTFAGQSALRTWLFGIIRNVASKHRRTARRKEDPQEPLDADLPHPGGDPLESAQDMQAAAFVRRFLAEVGEKKRDVFLLAVIEQMSIPEVADALGIPLNTAYTRLRAARADFERALAKHGGTP